MANLGGEEEGCEETAANLDCEDGAANLGGEVGRRGGAARMERRTLMGRSSCEEEGRGGSGNDSEGTVRKGGEVTAGQNNAWSARWHQTAMSMRAGWCIKGLSQLMGTRAY